MTPELRFSVLVTFLEQEHILSKYVWNIKKHPFVSISKPGDQPVDYIKRLCESDSYLSVFSNAFPFQVTDEGYEFWSGVCDRWCKKFKRV